MSGGVCLVTDDASLRSPQENALRDTMQSTLQENREHLQTSHAVQLEKLRLQLDTQMQKIQLANSRKVRGGAGIIGKPFIGVFSLQKTEPWLCSSFFSFRSLKCENYQIVWSRERGS